jgi:ABC-type transport system involved in cytochrome c biogenesis permease subunit
MGKAADNERLKLTATFLNNIAVTLIAAAAGLPLYKVFTKTTPQLIARLQLMSLWEMVDRGSGVIGALLLAISIHTWARWILSKSQD